MTRRMLLAAAIVAALALPSTAAVSAHEGCQTVGDGPTLKVTCSYTASGPGSYVAATPNDWRIYVIRGGTEVVLAEGTFGPPSTGPVASVAGETVAVEMGDDPPGDCVPGTTVCGTVGFVRSGHNAP